MKWRIPPKWGIRLFSAWAAVLAILAVARLLLLTQSVELYSNLNSNQWQVWIIFGINVTLAVGFGASAYGLWQHHNWGRLAFLWIVGLWTGFNLLVLLIPGLLFAAPERSWSQLLFTGFRYVLGLGLSLLYLNLPQIRLEFDQDPSNILS